MKLFRHIMLETNHHPSTFPERRFSPIAFVVSSHKTISFQVYYGIMVKPSIELSSGRRTTRVDYKEDGTIVSETNTSHEHASTYKPHSESDDEEVVNDIHSKKMKFSSKTNIESVEELPLWRIVTNEVILCGKRSLHCKNVGNNLFRDYVAAAVLLDVKFETNKSYNKEFFLAEIYEKLKNFEWRKMEVDKGLLPEIDRKTKIRKAFND